MADCNEYYAWELVEVLRRFLLVGVACVIRPGTVHQILLGAVVALTFLVVQTQARPFRRLAEGFLSMASGFMLVVIFFCGFLLQVDTLNDQTEITAFGEVSLSARLTPELRDRFASASA
eukprot:5230945-Prymnesium_polylepis.1